MQAGAPAPRGVPAAPCATPRHTPPRGWPLGFGGPWLPSWPGRRGGGGSDAMTPWPAGPSGPHSHVGQGYVLVGVSGCGGTHARAVGPLG